MPEPDQTIATEPLDLFGHTASDDFGMYIGGTSTDWRGVPVSRGAVTEIDGLRTTPIDRRHQQDAVRVEFAGKNAAQVYLSVPDGEPLDLKRYLNAGGSIEFELAIDTEPRGPLWLAMHCVWPCIGKVDLAGYPAGAVGRRGLGNGHGPAGRSRRVRDGLRVRHDPVPDLRRYTADDKDRAGQAGALAVRIVPINRRVTPAREEWWVLFGGPGCTEAQRQLHL